MTSVLVQHHLHWSISGTPSVALSNPHVGSSFVDVDQVLLVTDSASQIDCKRLDSFRWANFGRLLIPVSNSTVSDAMSMVERDQSLWVDFEPCLLLEYFGPFRHGVPTPGVQRRLAQEILGDDPRDFAFLDVMRFEVALHAVDPAVVVVPVLLEREPDAAGPQTQPLADLLER
jgi:hypothetical protein